MVVTFSEISSSDDADFQSAQGETGSYAEELHEEIEPESDEIESKSDEFFEPTDFEPGDIVEYNAEAEDYQNLTTNQDLNKLRKNLKNQFFPNKKLKPANKINFSKAKTSLKQKIEQNLWLGVVLRVDNDQIVVHFQEQTNLKTLKKKNRKLHGRTGYVKNVAFHFKMFCEANSDPDKAELYDFMFKNPDLVQMNRQKKAKRLSRNYIWFANKIEEGKCLSKGSDLQTLVENCLKKKFRNSNVVKSFAVKEEGKLENTSNLTELKNEQSNGTGFYKETFAAFPNGFLNWLTSLLVPYYKPKKSKKNGKFVEQEIRRRLAKSAVAIQRIVRGHSTRRNLDKRKQNATAIQRIVRGHSTRRKFDKRKQSATAIQRIVRGGSTRRNLDKRKQKATAIQRIVRGYSTRQKLQKEKRASAIAKTESKRKTARTYNTSIPVSPLIPTRQNAKKSKLSAQTSNSKNISSKKRTRMTAQERPDNWLEEYFNFVNRFAENKKLRNYMIQSHAFFPDFSKEQLSANIIRKKFKNYHAKKQKNASTIQKAFKKYQEQKEAKQRSATKIQAIIRQKNAKKELAKLKQQRSATKIQAIIRQRNAKKELAKLKRISERKKQWAQFAVQEPQPQPQAQEPQGQNNP